ncbi:hypothetical protein ES703_73812 [subsurface metagenome]
MWQERFFAGAHTKLRKKILCSVSILIIVVGIINIVLYLEGISETRRLKEERLILTELKVKFEVIGPLTEDTQVAHIFGSPIRLEVLSKRDTLITPFYLSSPIRWDVKALPSNQAMIKIFFSCDPEMPLIGKRIKLLERYDAIKVPLGKIAKSLNLSKVTQIVQIMFAIYVNGIEVRRVDFPSKEELTWGYTDLEMNEKIVHEWYSRPFRNIEQEYLQTLCESTNYE